MQIRQATWLFLGGRRNRRGVTAENMGRRLGWQEADTAEFAETLRAVGDATSGDLTN